MSSSSNPPAKKSFKNSPRNVKKTPKASSARSHKEPAKSKNVDTASEETKLVEKCPETILIRVIDDCGGGVERVFECERGLLLSRMPYFRDCLAGEGLSISVHCDVAVFTKIMDYIRQDKKFKFEAKYAIHLLVSADFLQMGGLVEECLHFCHRHMNAVIENNCPIAALNPHLLDRLALLFNHREVESLKDPGGRIKEKLYRILLDRLVGGKRLMRCALCEQVFATQLQPHVPCKSNKATIGPRGELIYTHKRDVPWNVDRYVEDQFAACGSWRRIYWRVWGLTHALPPCTVCGAPFPACDFTRCPHHPAPPPADTAPHRPGVFACCGHRSFKFDPLDPLFLLSGCAYRNHSVCAGARGGEVFQDMLTYFDLMGVPQPPRPPEPPLVTPPHSERALAQWLRALRPNAPELRKVSSKLSVSSDGSSSTNRSAESLAVCRKEEKQHPTALFTPLLSALGHGDTAGSDVKQVWKAGGSLWHNQDAVREHDARQMELLMLELQKIQCRTRHKP